MLQCPEAEGEREKSPRTYACLLRMPSGGCLMTKIQYNGGNPHVCASPFTHFSILTVVITSLPHCMFSLQMGRLVSIYNIDIESETGYFNHIETAVDYMNML